MTAGVVGAAGASSECGGCCGCLLRAVPCGVLSEQHLTGPCELEECETHPDCPDPDAFVPFTTNGSADGTVGSAPCGCPDLDDDDAVTSFDTFALLGNWGAAGTGDLNNDGAVTGHDLGILLAQFGAFDCAIDTPQCAADGSALALQVDAFNVTGCRHRLVFSVGLDSGDRVVNVYNVTADYAEEIEPIPMLGVEVEDHVDLDFDPNFDAFLWAFSQQMGTDAGWYNTDPSNSIGDADSYTGGKVPVFAIERPICTSTIVNYSLSVTIRRANGTIEQVEFSITAGPIEGDEDFEIACSSVSEFGPYWCHVRRVACDDAEVGDVFSTGIGCFQITDSPPRSFEPSMSVGEPVDQSCADCCGVTGGCCIEGNCSLKTPGECASLGGQYLGDGVPCTSGVCSNPCAIQAASGCPTSLSVSATLTVETSVGGCNTIDEMTMQGLAVLRPTGIGYDVTYISGTRDITRVGCGVGDAEYECPPNGPGICRYLVCGINCRAADVSCSLSQGPRWQAIVHARSHCASSLGYESAVYLKTAAAGPCAPGGLSLECSTPNVTSSSLSIS